MVVYKIILNDEYLNIFYDRIKSCGAFRLPLSKRIVILMAILASFNLASAWVGIQNSTSINYIPYFTGIFIFSDANPS